MADDGFSIGKGARIALFAIESTDCWAVSWSCQGAARTNTTSAPVIAEAQANKKQSEPRKWSAITRCQQQRSSYQFGASKNCEIIFRYIDDFYSSYVLARNCDVETENDYLTERRQETDAARWIESIIVATLGAIQHVMTKAIKLHGAALKISGGSAGNKPDKNIHCPLRSNDLRKPARRKLPGEG